MKSTPIIFILSLILMAGFVATVEAQRAYRLSEQEMKHLLKSIETGADHYKHSLNQALDESHFDSSKAEDNINQFVKDFEAATDRLKHQFDDNRSAAGLVETVLNRAALIDRFMVRNRLNERAQGDWEQLRGNLDQLAQAYQVSWTWDGTLTPAYRVTDKEVEKLLNRLDERAKHFRKSLDEALDHSRLDGSKAEDNINQFVKDFEKATDHLKDRFGKKQSASGDVEEVLRRAARLNDFMQRHPLNAKAQSDWNDLRSSLDELANSYQVTWTW